MRKYMTASKAIRWTVTALTLVLIHGLSAFALAHSEAEGPEEPARAVIMMLEDTWNSGDMTGYLAQYQQDDSLSLTFGNTVVEGWTALNTLFRKSYPDPKRMGRFSIDRLDVQMLREDAAIAYGNFTHVFPKETIKGGFTHVLSRNTSGKWIIRHERTSRGEVIETH